MSKKTYLIVPDVHDKVNRADHIIKSIPHDEAIFLGDVYDSFFDEENLGIVEKTARWHKQALNNPKNTFLHSNHDMPMAFPNKRLPCSGHRLEKKEICNSILTKEDWAKTKFFVFIDGWLLTHAGLSKPLIGGLHLTEKLEDYLIAESKNALIAANTLNKSHWFFEAGMARGGAAFLGGGITWNDFHREFQPIKGVKQIFGHTYCKEPTWKYYKQNLCLDTDLNHFATIHKGKVTIGNYRDL